MPASIFAGQAFSQTGLVLNLSPATNGIIETGRSKNSAPEISIELRLKSEEIYGFARGKESVSVNFFAQLKNIPAQFGIFIDQA